MTFLYVLLIVCAVETFGAHHTDIDFNRIKRVPEEVQFKSTHQSEQQVDNQIRRSNDYDDHSGWYAFARALSPPIHDVPSTNVQEPPGQVYQPREDPRLFYQSDTYLKDIHQKNVNKEVTYIYPGKNVVRASEKNVERFSKLREDTSDSANDICVKCPRDRTLVAKTSSGKVLLKSPRLQTCSGRKAPRSVKFVHMYGRRFGALLEQGSHMIIGQIVSKNKSLQLCKMQVHVVVQGCVTPKYLEAHCWDHNKRCNFTCRNSNLELSGPSFQICGDDMKWGGVLPVCKARTWCPFPMPPERGRVSCQGQRAGVAGLQEGARCRVRCARGWRASRATACRRGAWTNALICTPRNSQHQKQISGPGVQND